MSAHELSTSNVWVALIEHSYGTHSRTRLHHQEMSAAEKRTQNMGTPLNISDGVGPDKSLMKGSHMRA